MKNHGYEHLLSFALEHPWALTDPMRQVVAGILARHLAGQDTSPDVIEAAVKSRKETPQPTRGGVAIIPVHGVIAPRMNLLSDISGGTTFEGLTAQLREALANEDVTTVLFDVDSPGGNVAGASEFAAEVMKARAKKPIVAQVQYLGASAAYWTMAAATQIVAAPSALVGSIGVFGMHDDLTDALAKLGVKRTIVAAGKYKTEALPGAALSDEAREHLQHLVDQHYSRFVADVALGRGVKESTVRGGYGEGRVLVAAEALDEKMIDKIATLDETLARLSDTPHSKARMTATAQELPLAATAQERTSDVAWQNSITAELLTLHL